MMATGAENSAITAPAAAAHDRTTWLIFVSSSLSDRESIPGACAPAYTHRVARAPGTATVNGGRKLTPFRRHTRGQFSGDAAAGDRKVSPGVLGFPRQGFGWSVLAYKSADLCGLLRILDADRKDRLQNLPGWTWHPHGDKWEEGFSRLLDYVKRNGDARVAQSYTDDGYNLGAWVSNQRQSHRRGTLDPDRERRLQDLPGWTVFGGRAKYSSLVSSGDSQQV